MTIHTGGPARAREPGVVALLNAVQQVVPLQEAIERAEDGGIEHYVKRDGSASGEVGEDETPAQCQSINQLINFY